MNRRWCKTNPEKARAAWTRKHRKQGHLPFNENKKCTLFLGVHIAEEVLSQAFKNVQRMPMNNPGYDFICGRGYKIDVKSSCLHKDGRWQFNIKRNNIADYFLMLAFDNRQDLNPMYVWLIPGGKLNHLRGTGINPSTIHKWDGYRLDVSKVVACCNILRET